MRLDILLERYRKRYTYIRHDESKVKIAFFDRFIPWPARIRDWECWEEVTEYFDNPTGYWEKYGRHHPFLSPDCCDPSSGQKPYGHRYHVNFSKLGLDWTYARSIDFVELLSGPVDGHFAHDWERNYYNDVEVFDTLMRNPSHISVLRRILDENNRVVFLGYEVYHVLMSHFVLYKIDKSLLNERFEAHSQLFTVLHDYKQNYWISSQNFTNITDDSYYPRYRRMIDSIVKDKPMEWDVILPGSNQTLKLKCEFKQLLSEIRKWHPETENLSGITLNPLKEINPRLYQLPALTRFFENNEQNKGSINCLIHSILPLPKKKELMPHILDYYANIKIGRAHV